MLCEEFIVGFCAWECGGDVIRRLLGRFAGGDVFFEWGFCYCLPQGGERLGDACVKGREGGLEG